jgi:hypothetical protein
MKTDCNDTFQQLLTEYDLPADLLFNVDIPIEVQSILHDSILITDLGITLKSFGGLYKATETWENQSVIEDNENHFHVDNYVDPPDNKKAFMLGVKTLVLLAKKFQKEKINGIRFTFSFQTPELGRQWTKQNNLDDDTDDYFISDRLSFLTRRDGEQIGIIKKDEKQFWALLTIDV